MRQLIESVWYREMTVSQTPSTYENTLPNWSVWTCHFYLVVNQGGAILVPVWYIPFPILLNTLQLGDFVQKHQPVITENQLIKKGWQSKPRAYRKKLMYPVRLSRGKFQPSTIFRSVQNFLQNFIYLSKEFFIFSMVFY